MAIATGTQPPSNTNVVFQGVVIREDLSDYVYKISPLETPALQAIGRKGKWRTVLHEWPTVELLAANPDNAIIEGADVSADPPTIPHRLSNYTQIMTKVKRVSSTDEAVIGAGDVQRMAKQVTYATQELKRDIEARLVAPGNRFANSGSGNTVARQTASIAAFINTNAQRGAGGSAAPLSAPPNGFPTTPGETPGTARSMTGTAGEAIFKTAIQGAWVQGGNPDLVLCPAPLKVIFSTYTGNATRFKKAEDKRLVAAIDVYTSDFGEVQIVPDRFFTDPTNVASGTAPTGGNPNGMRALILDRELLEVGWLQSMRNVPLAKTGLSDARLISCEWGIVVGNEKGLAMVSDVSNN